ncbi:MAG: hypothetical protein QFX32_07920 [Methanolinea sp.]|nr:hypothetical protein [Methanolinea sp.]
MRRTILLAAATVLCIACLALAGMRAGSPLLYSPASDARADGHVNPLALRPVTGERGARMITLLADVIGTPGSIVLNIKSGDFENAARDLREYSNLVKSLDSLVVQIDLDEKDITEFRRASKKNLQILAELLNGTERWDELRSLELRFREAGDTGAVTSIRYEGEALNMRIQDLYREYLAHDEVILSTGERFEIDTSGYRASISDFREIVDRVTREHEEGASGPGSPVEYLYPSGTKPLLTLEVSPRRASYGDTVVARGRVENAPAGLGPEIDLYIDLEKAGTVTGNPDGSFSYSHPVERDRAGTHTVFAVLGGSVFSPMDSFSVEEIPTALSLDTPLASPGKVQCRGNLHAGPRPVRQAPVEIFAGGSKLATVHTGDDGSFSAGLRLAPGAYRVRAVFHADGFPLLPSESEPREVVVPAPAAGAPGGEPAAGPVALLVPAGLLCLAGAGSLYYLRRRAAGSRAARRPQQQVPRSLENEAPREEDVVHPRDAAAPGVAPEGHAATTVEITWQGLLRSLRGAIGERESIRSPQSLTPREMCGICRDLRARDLVCRFAEWYEKVVYAGETLPEEEGLLVVQHARDALRILGEGDH